MFNHAAMDKIPTVNQIKAIIEYMEKDPDNSYFFDFMMDMNRTKPNVIYLDLNDAHVGTNYRIEFNDNDEIIKFEKKGNWIS